MTRTKIISHSVRLSEMALDDFYDDLIYDPAEGKAHRIELRRWRKLKHQLI